MSLVLIKDITRKSWDIIPMPDTVIDLVYLLGKYQQQILVFTDDKVQLIGDGNAEITEVDVYGDYIEAPSKSENENDLYYHEDKQEVPTNHEDQTIK